MAATTQMLLFSELLMRRLLYVVMPVRRGAVQRYADNSVLSSLAAAVLQAATVPLQAVASLLASGTRVWVLMLVLGIVFTSLFVMSSSSVYAYSALIRMYNTGVAPVVGGLKWLFILLDFVFRATVPLWNGGTHLLSQILRRLIVPSSFTNVDVVPEILQGLALCLGSLGRSIVTWLGRVRECTLGYEDVLRECTGAALANMTRVSDCTTVFTVVDSRCYASPSHLTMDLLTPGLFARQAVQSLQGIIAESCGVAAVVLNLLMYPLCDHQLYAAAHAGVNSLIFTAVGLPISTWRRCQALENMRGLPPAHRKVGCTPDWQPVAAMAESALTSFGKALDNWLNAMAVVVNERVSGVAHECETNVPLKDIVLNAARAIEGLESVEALQRLEGRNGMPESETLRSVRVVGLTPKLFGVTDGKSVLYRSAHDGYVLAFGAWPLAVDVRFGLAAVTYGGSAAEADSAGDARTGLLGCRCVDTPEFTLLCSTAPYVQHIDDDLAGLNASSVHRVSFPGVLLAGMTCANTAVRVMPLRWPRRRLATTEGGGGSGFAGYDRFSYLNIVDRFTGDIDATDNLRLLAARERNLPSGSVEAAIYVQPVCGSDNSITCAPQERDNCFPWCMGVVRGGRRAQNITMYNARKWEEHVILPDVDCGVASDKGACDAVDGERVPLVDIMLQAGVVRARCAATCSPAPVPGSVMSLVPIETIAADANETLHRVQMHKKQVWLAVRLAQPIVVAGDVMLAVATQDVAGNTDGKTRLVVTRLYDIGQSTLQMASERLTLTRNAHAAEVAECPTQADTKCVAQAMQEGKVVLPPAVQEVRGDVADAEVVLPAAASRWAVHWAQNPEVSVYNTLFEFCRNATPQFRLTVPSSYNRARVWTMQTMRAVDMEREGAPSEEQQRSRVSYMRVPYFLGENDYRETACDKVVGLRIVGVEYLNEQNVLVTVLAARPIDYNASAGTVVGARTHRYYYLHPGRHDCQRTDDEEALPDNPKIFSCWRSHASGMWPPDDVVSEGVWARDGGRCPRPRLVPEFGTAAVTPFVAWTRVLETTLDAVGTLTAMVAVDHLMPTRAMEQLFTVQLRQTAFHAMVDSAGARLLRVEGIIQSAEWLAAFNARLVSFIVNSLSSVSTNNERVDKAVAGVRTLVVASTKVYEGMPATEQPFLAVEKMFREPIAYSGLHASVAVLTMADGLKDGVVMPAVVRAFIAAQLQLVSVFNVVLRVGRVILLRLMQTVGTAADGRQTAATSIVSAALLESRAIVENDYLGTLRFQCFGFSQMVGSTTAWGQALRHMCLLLPDTLEGLMTVGSVLALEYPVVACACKLGEGDALDTPLDAVVALCLQRPMPIESTQWLLALRFESASRQEVCFAAMDSANTRFKTAFDKTYKRLFQMTKHAAQVADGLLALATGDTVACDAFDVSPYVLSIIPEPVDYFSSCVDTDDCAARCLDEYSAFEEARRDIESGGTQLGFSTALAVPLESLLFSLDDIEKGLNRPPFQILDAVELPPQSCSVVCGQVSSTIIGNRCLLLAGLRGVRQLQVAVAYYCLPIDITQYVFQWPGMESSTLPPAGTSGGFANVTGSVRAVYAATSWAAQRKARDSVIVLIDSADGTARTNIFPDNPARVTRVLWCVPGLPAREILRTSLLSERRLDAPSTPLFTKTFLYKIEHVQIDVAASDDADVVLRAFGYSMLPVQVQGAVGGDTPVLTWDRPTQSCVECVFESDPALFTEAVCQACDADEAPTTESVQREARVCLQQGIQEDTASCAESIVLPTMRPVAGGFVTRAAEDAQAAVRVRYRAESVSRLLRVPTSTLSVLQNDAQSVAYMDLEERVHARVSMLSGVAYLPAPQMRKLREIVVNGSHAEVELELLTVNAQSSQGAWLHVLSLRIGAQGITGVKRNWLRGTTKANVVVNCSIHNCGACAQSTDGSARSADGSARESFRQLENLCYAAQQCGVERCAGTLVNMRKPLCNLGSVLVSELHAVRVLLQGLWGAIADNVAMVVELTHERRQEYQLKWPEKLVRQEACTAKDTIVSVAATITSVLGAFSHLMQDVSLHHGFVGSNVDSRVHARYIMVLTATTNMLASVFLWPVYQGLVLQKFFSCTVNDVLYNIDTLISDGQPQISIRFGDPRAATAIQDAGIAVCLSEDVRQSLQDAGVRVREAGRDGDAEALRVVRKLSDAISNSVDVGLSAYVQYAYHVMDIWLTWGASVLMGAMDVAQTVDWENCKLPVVDTGLQSVGLCACGDEAHAIPAEEKKKRWTDQAFWCSGFLMLNEGDGSDLLVWNPYSLQELLDMQGKTAGGYDEYITCLRQRWDSASQYNADTCESRKLRAARLDRQGVEVMQVISRCRANYQQSRWDEASVMFSLFDAAEWRTVSSLAHSASARKDDKYTALRKQVVRLLENDADLRSDSTLLLPDSVWGCLQDQLRAGVLQHDCHRSVTTFAYTAVKNAAPREVDACKVLSGDGEALQFPRFLWSGNSRNHVPLAKLHPTLQTPAERQAQAATELTKLLDEIEAEFDKLMNTSFEAELRNDVRVETFSSEGDELHQLVDCVIMGPYSSADLSSNLHFDNLQKLPVPQYHRGKPDSREFASSGDTGGSEARRSLMKKVFEFTNEQVDNATVAAVSKHLRMLAEVWLDVDNFKCICSNGRRGLDCCSSTGPDDFVLRDQVLSREQWDIENAVQRHLFEQLVTSEFLQETLWTTRVGEAIPLTAAHRAELHAAHLFATSGHVPVRTYSIDDTVPALNTHSLWETCTSRLAGLFATLPLTDKTVNGERGRASEASTVHVAPEVFDRYNPSVDHAEDRVHSLELLVDAVLERSRALAPHFWTHAHRYVASDSVWCENTHGNKTKQTPPVINTPAALNVHELRSEPVLAPDADQLVYPADVLHACACGWADPAGVCHVPAEVCEAGRQALNASDARLADGRSKREAWTSLCETQSDARASYYSREDLLLVLQVLPDLSDPVLRSCSARQLSTAWGLLTPEQYEEWYSGSSKPQNGSWEVNAQHLATAGPGGLRIGMLASSSRGSMQEYMRVFELGERLTGEFNARNRHTIAQPVCEGTLREYLTQDLRRYFPDVFLPMAHAVQIVPAVEHCGRWVLEYAMWSVLRSVPHTPSTTLARQAASATLWRGRCAAQMHEVGLCALRGVYDIVPSSAPDISACAFAGPAHTVTGCARHYYTSGCLLYCDGIFYDPCLCGYPGECAPRPFDPTSCTRGRLHDGRALLRDDEVLLTSSLSWPADITPAEADNDTHWQMLRLALERTRTVSKHDDLDFAGLYARARDVLLSRVDEEEAPAGYCDDLFDYWPDVQHPVGYHPSTACGADATHTRGFDAWMSRDEAGNAMIDPVRMRNMTLLSQVFGAAHLVCDAHAYAAPGHRLNPFYMQSRWDAKAHADPAVPTTAEQKTVNEMPTWGVPSFDQTDTPLRGQGHTAEALLQHSVGLVRAWAMWFPHANSSVAETEAARAQLNASWPHWLYDEVNVAGVVLEHAGLFLGHSPSAPAGCAFPRLRRCLSNADCQDANGFKCLLNFHEEENTRRGICMPADSCYQHKHCAADKLCSGEGRCVEPRVFVRNDASWDSEIQLFGRAGCHVSMQRLSRFESVPDFARANGMCSFRDWFHYTNTTAGVAPYKHLKSVPDRVVHHTDAADPQSLQSLAVLKTLGHQCDRSYTHTNFQACLPESSTFNAGNSNVDSAFVAAARTWKLDDEVWHARFCAMQDAEEVSGFLHPYAERTLHNAARDIKRCIKLGLCPSTSFHVRGRAVEDRRVRAHTLSEDSPNGVKQENSARDYCGLDAQRCWGMGFLLGLDCADVGQERSSLCVVDTLVLPLLPITYATDKKVPITDVEFAARLAELRGRCPRAFQYPFRNYDNLALFKDVFLHLTQPYAWTDTARRQRVLEYANGLFWFLFGVPTDAARGFATVDEYLRHSTCAVFVASALSGNEQSVAALQDRESFSFYQSSRTGAPLADADPVIPGASLYIFDRRLPVSINLRWLMQCVVLSKDKTEGGVMASFLVDLNSGTLSTRYDSVDCENYRHDEQDTASLPLSAWLRKAKFLFTQLESTELSALQISIDVFGSISRALSQLPVLDMPDLVCVAAKDGWTAPGSGQSVFASASGLLGLHRFANPALGFDNGAAETGVDTTKRIFEDAGNTSVYDHVLKFLLKGTAREGWDWNADSLASLRQLETDGVLKDMHIEADHVTPRAMYPRYQFTNLQKLSTLYDDIAATVETEDSYTDEDSRNICQCSQLQQVATPSLCRNRKRLAKPEYSLSASVVCEGLRLLPCTAAGVTQLLDERNRLDPPFLSQKELLYLVLLIFEYEISYTASGGFTTLHRITDAEQAQFVDDMYSVPLVNSDSTLSLHEAAQFNQFLDQHDSTNLKCPPRALDYFQETNTRHKQMRQCRDSLRENIGWRLRRGHTLALAPAPSTLLAGFYLSHMQEPGDTFLDTLLDTNWTEPENTALEDVICHVREDATEVMAPFWAEYFDVASEDSLDEPPLACDIEPSSAASVLMLYDTLCASSMTSPSARTCADQPRYRQHLENSMPAACARQDGRVVVRRRIGALRGGRLCDRKPEGLEAACTLKHGSFNGHAGEHAQDLDTVSALSTIQRGFWEKTSTIFRGAQDTSELTALALNEFDIAGHCLGFSLSARGTLYLRSAALQSICNPTSASGQVRGWLADVEQEWAWDHAHSQALHDVQAEEAVSWTCPLHWLQQYHDDDGRHQARSPSWQRNSARFEHITGAHKYAHPTVRHANRLRGLRAARFLGDALACVAAAEHCHGAAYLDKTITDILQPDWRPVAYVPERHPECNRTLDWPVDCGKARPDGQRQQPGECDLRN